MNWRHLWSNKKLRGCAIAAAIIVGVPIGCCAFLRISSAADIKAYLGMASECHPVWKRFALRQFNAGDSAAELFRRFPPSDVEEFGRYGVYYYSESSEGAISFTRLRVITRAGKLLSAGTGSCTWRFTFFSTDDPELEKQYAAYYQEKREQWARDRRQKLELQN